MCGALREAHEAGLVHRDIKPANVVLCFHGGLPDVVKVLDFGLVKQIATDAQVSRSDSSAIVGTPLFMSPEEISAPGSVGPQSDLYSVGAVAYFLLTGEPVFAGDNVIQVCGHHLHTLPVPPSQRTSRPVPSDVEALVRRCRHLEREPVSRLVGRARRSPNQRCAWDRRGPPRCAGPGARRKPYAARGSRTPFGRASVTHSDDARRHFAGERSLLCDDLVRQAGSMPALMNQPDPKSGLTES
jgi:serine/threonine protein kinase